MNLEEGEHGARICQGSGTETGQGRPSDGMKTMDTQTYRSRRGSFGHTFRRKLAAVAAYSLALTTVVVGAFPIAPVTPADAAPGDGVCYLIADSGGGNGGNDLLTIVDRGDFDPATNETNSGTGTGTNNIEALDMHPATLLLYGANANRLGTVDKLTGVYSPLPNTFGTADHSTLPSVSITDVDGLAFDYLTGELWGAERQGGNDVLVRIDITTGSIIPDSFGPGNDYLPTNVGGLGHDDVDQLVIFAKLDGNDAPPHRPAIGLQRGLLDETVLGGHHEIVVGKIEFAYLPAVGDFLPLV